MILDSPCDEPSEWGGEWRSKQTTCAPRVASLHPVAAPIAPQPTTATRRAAKALFGRDPGDRLTGLHRVAHVQQQLVDLSAQRRWNLGVDLVGVRFHQRFALGDVLTLLLAPRTDRDLVSALELGHQDILRLDSHRPILARSMPSHSRPAKRRRGGPLPSSRLFLRA